LLGHDFVGPIPSSFSNEYIPVIVDYVSKWVEVVAYQKNYGNTVIKFLTSKSSRFGVTRVLINGGGYHFYNAQLEMVLQNYDVRHKFVSPHHP